MNETTRRRIMLWRWGIGARIFGRWCVLRRHATNPPLFSERYCADTRSILIGPLRLTIRPKPGTPMHLLKEPRYG